MSKTLQVNDARRAETIARKAARRAAIEDLKKYGIPYGTVKIDPDDTREYDPEMWNVIDREYRVGW